MCVVGYLPLFRKDLGSKGEENSIPWLGWKAEKFTQFSYRLIRTSFILVIYMESLT